MPTAVLIDGAFFLKRFPVVYPKKDAANASEVAETLFKMALDHLEDKDHRDGRRNLYRIFFYDCPPHAKKAHYPISGKAVDFSKSRTAIFRLALYEALKRKRKVALRMGHLLDESRWNLKPDVLPQLLKKERTFDQLRDEDFIFYAPQKGVDMRIGLDISSLAFKHQVDQIVLVAGDSDFVPAAKQARREGIDFVLDPMWVPVHDHLFEHIDGMRSVAPKPQVPAKTTPGARS